MMIRILDVLLLRSPPLLWVGVRTGDAEGYSMVVASRDGGYVLLDPDGGRVARTFAGRALDREQIEYRRRWADHVAAPPFEVREGGRLLLEEYVVGRHLTELSSTEQETATRGVFSAYTALTAAEAEPASQPSLMTLRARPEWRDIPVVLQEIFADERGDVPEPWPMVPTAIDTYSNNVVCQRDDGSVTFIDCFPLVLQPFFVVPLICVARWSRQAPQLREIYLSGGFDDQLEALAGAAGVDLAATLPRRRFLLAASILSLAVAGGGHAPREQLDMSRLCRRLEGRLEYYGLDARAAWSPAGSGPERLGAS